MFLDDGKPELREVFGGGSMYDKEERLRQLFRTLYYASGGRIASLTTRQSMEILKSAKDGEQKETKAI